ncbi:Unknown protein, partial [Striga hermonthica]
FFEFHPTFCLVKDQVTKTILLRGTLEDGLYRFSFQLHKDNQTTPMQPRKEDYYVNFTAFNNNLRKLWMIVISLIKEMKTLLFVHLALRQRATGSLFQIPYLLLLILLN